MMDKEDEMKKLFKKLPWLREQLEIEREILKHQTSVEIVYERVLRSVEWAEHLD